MDKLPLVKVSGHEPESLGLLRDHNELTGRLTLAIREFYGNDNQPVGFVWINGVADVVEDINRPTEMTIVELSLPNPPRIYKKMELLERMIRDAFGDMPIVLALDS